MKGNTGFTLVELIIVIAIMAVVIGIAVPIYNDNLNEARTVKVMAHYDTAVKAIRSHSALIATQQARGVSVSLPTTSSGWIDIIDPDGTAVSPSGDAAYADTVDDTKGIVGIALNADATQVTVSRPKYATLGGNADDENITTVISLN